MPVHRSYVTGLALVGVLSASASAAVITGTPVGSPPLPANLTAAGTLDWAVWNHSDQAGFASMSPSHRMLNGAGIISNATAVGGDGQVRGSSTLSNVTVSFTNGIGGTSASGMGVAGVFNHELNTNGSGVQVDITLPNPGQYAVSIWVSGRSGQGVLTAALPGATTYTNSAYTYTTNKLARLYQLDVTADNPMDVLNISYVLANSANNSSHALIAAVAVSAVPEPTALAGLGLLGVGLLSRRRRTTVA